MIDPGRRGKMHRPLCALFGGQETIRDYIAFPKNNMGRDVMLDAPSRIDDIQMDELFLKSTAPEK